MESRRNVIESPISGGLPFTPDILHTRKLVIQQCGELPIALECIRTDDTRNLLLYRVAIRTSPNDSDIPTRIGDKSK